MSALDDDDAVYAVAFHEGSRVPSARRWARLRLVLPLTVKWPPMYQPPDPSGAEA